MKRTTILFIIGAIILVSGHVGIPQLSGMVLYKDLKTKEPSDFLSAFVAKFDRPKVEKTAYLDQAKHIKFVDGERYNKFKIYYGDTSLVRISNYRDQIAIDQKVQGDTLEISLGKVKLISVDIYLDSIHSPTLIFENVGGDIQCEASPIGLLKRYHLQITKHSNIRFSTQERDNLANKNNLQVSISGESTFSLKSGAYDAVNIYLNNGMMHLWNETMIDSLQADFQGLSNIAGLKNKNKDMIKSIKLSGDLNYHHSRIK